MNEPTELNDDAPPMKPHQAGRMIKALWSTCMGLIALILGLGFWIANNESKAAADRANTMRHIEETQTALIQVDTEVRAQMSALFTATATTDSLTRELRHTQRQLARLRQQMRRRFRALEQADSLARHQ